VLSQKSFKKMQVPVLKGFQNAAGVDNFCIFLRKVSSGFWESFIKGNIILKKSLVIVLSTFKRAGVTLFCVFLRKVFSGF
jgi:hypothetical protein